jgi:hypothetical protein
LWIAWTRGGIRRFSRPNCPIKVENVVVSGFPGTAMSVSKRSKTTEIEMIGAWSSWKPFPIPEHGEHVEAPIGPGLYEVCHVVTQELVAFGHATNVAQALSNVLRPTGARKWLLFRRLAPPRYHSSELEYRTFAAGTVAEARIAAEVIIGHRQTLWRRIEAMRRM